MLQEEVGRTTDTLIAIAADPARAAEIHALIGPFFHLIRNRLNSLQMCVYLGRRTEAIDAKAAWEELDQAYRQAEKIVDVFQGLCRPMPLSPIPMGLDLILNDVAARWSPQFAGRQATLQVDARSGSDHGRVDPSRWSCVLNMLADWRCHRVAPGTGITLRAGVREGRSFVEWDERTARPGEPDPGGILPLAMMARVASAHGGTMSRDDRNGLRLAADWPPAIATPIQANRPIAAGVP